jgi:exopolysaccharide biosynthesis polyprenyl glycosylphosphotransferase
LENFVTSKAHSLPPKILDVLKLLDPLLVSASFAIATLLVVHAQSKIPLWTFLSMRIKVSNFLVFVFALVLCHLMFRLLRLYHARHFRHSSEELGALAKAATCAFACFLIVDACVGIRMITAPFLVLFWACAFLLLAGSRRLLHLSLHYRQRSEKNQRCVLVFGTNNRAIAFGQHIRENPVLGYRLLGFVDDPWAGMADFEKTGFSVVSNLDGLAEFLRKNVVEEAVIYLPMASFYPSLANIARLCALHGIGLRFNSDIFDVPNARWRAESGIGSPYLSTHTGIGGVWSTSAKRLLDIALSGLLLVALSPLFLVAALSVALTSPGPVFFLQERVGLNKRRFKIYKFRTMVPDAEKLIHALVDKNEAGGPTFKIKHDPRITPVGRWLRKTSIDELPQLINVLKGDMSLVGPRPLPVRDYEGFNEDWQRRRFSAKPGITCLWQVKGRSSITFGEWMLLDLQYLDEWSLWLDLKILARTVPVVIRGSGAA